MLQAGPCVSLTATISVAFVVGMIVGHVSAGQWKTPWKQRHRDDQDGHGKGGGAKRRARIQKRAIKARALADAADAESAPHLTERRSGHISRRRRRRSTQTSSKDLALDAFVRVARQHIDYIGAGDYESIFLLPREALITAGKFLAFQHCQDRLVSLGQARATTPKTDDLRILYVSCSWSRFGPTGVDWDEKDFESTKALLERYSDITYVYIGRSCMTNEHGEALRLRHLHHVPCVLLRADVLFVLPPPAGAPEQGAQPSSDWRPYSDLSLLAGNAWARMELALTAVGQAKTFFGLRVGRFSEETYELTVGTAGVASVAEHAAHQLRSKAVLRDAAAREREMHEPFVRAGGGGDKDWGTGEGIANSASSVMAEEACANWLSVQLDPLKALEEARQVVQSVAQQGEEDVLKRICSMLPTRDAAATERAHLALGGRKEDGYMELALPMLLFAVYCSKPKMRATYTDAFVEDAGNLDIVYRPIAVVCSPYRERFGTPRQPQVTAAVLHGAAQEGQIVFMKGEGYEEALEDLDGFDMIWVVSHMHLNKGWNSRVRPPRLHEQRKGLFSTRSPHRPNPVALSCLRVNRVDAAEGIIHVYGLDLLDGTPVLDVKPYIGYCDAFPNVKVGWLDELGSDHEEQGDFLAKYSVGAALVQTAHRTHTGHSSLPPPVVEVRQQASARILAPKEYAENHA